MKLEKDGKACKKKKKKKKQRPGREASIGCCFFDVLRYQNTPRFCGGRKKPAYISLFINLVM